jgi:hypothetical protein
MKRLLVVALTAFGLSVVATPAASPAGGTDTQGPPCANISAGDGGYSDGLHGRPKGELDFTVFLKAPACSFVTYSFFVTHTNGNPLQSSGTPDSDCTPESPGGGCVHFIFELGDTGPSTVCVYATTDIQGHVADRAPDGVDQTCTTPLPELSLSETGSGAGGTFG